MIGIKDIEMPNNCYECSLVYIDCDHNLTMCKLTDTIINDDVYMLTRAYECPLVEVDLNVNTDAFLQKYRKDIAEKVDDKMDYMGTCPNERDAILSIISPKDYPRPKGNHCGTDCWNKKCESYHVEKD